MEKTHATRQAALVARQDSLALPAGSVLAQREHQNRVVLESILSPPTVPQRPAEALRSVDADALVRALAPGVDGGLPRTPANFVYAIRVLGSQGRFDDALAMFAAMPSEPRAPAYAALLGACATQRNADAAWEVWGSMRDAGVSPTPVALGCLLQANIRARRLEEAFRALQEGLEAGVAPSTVLFTHLMVGCVHDGAYERAWEVWRHMRTHHPECAPDAVAYTTLINACGKTDDVERALGLLTEMRQLGVEPTHVTFNALIHAVGRSFRHHERAHALYHEMVAAGHARDARSYEGVLLACSHAGDTVRARGYMHAMLGEGIAPTRGTLNVLLAVYARAVGELGRAKVNPKDALMARAEGKELLEWDDPAKAAERAAALPPTLGEYGRLVDGQDVDSLVENLLADYFSNEPTGRPARADDEAVVENALDDDYARYLPDPSEFNEDMADAGFKETADALVTAGLVDRELLREVQEDNDALPPLTAAEAEVRGKALLRSQRAARRADEADALALARDELRVESAAREVEDAARALATQLGVDGGDTATIDAASERYRDWQAQKAAAVASGSPVPRRPGFRESLGALQREAVQRVLTGRLMIDEVTNRAPRGADAPPTASALLRRAASASSSAPGGASPRLSFLEYMRALEAEVQREVFGEQPLAGAYPASATGGSAGAIEGGERVSPPEQQQQQEDDQSGGNALSTATDAAVAIAPRSTLPSLFEEDGLIGGQPLSALLDIGAIPVPSTSDSEGDHDPLKMEAYYLDAVTERFEEALSREYEAAMGEGAVAGAGAVEVSVESAGGAEAAPPRPTDPWVAAREATAAAEAGGSDWDDPHLSDHAQEYLMTAREEGQLGRMEAGAGAGTGQAARAARRRAAADGVPAHLSSSSAYPPASLEQPMTHAPEPASSAAEAASAPDAPSSLPTSSSRLAFGSLGGVSRKQRRERLGRRPASEEPEGHEGEVPAATSAAVERSAPQEAASSPAAPAAVPAPVLETLAPAVPPPVPPASGMVRRRRSGVPAGGTGVRELPRPASLAAIIDPALAGEQQRAQALAAGVPSAEHFSAASALVAAFRPHPPQPTTQEEEEASAAAAAAADDAKPPAAVEHQPAPPAPALAAAAPALAVVAAQERSAVASWLAGVDDALGGEGRDSEAEWAATEARIRSQIDAALLAAGAVRNDSGEFVFDARLHGAGPQLPDTPEARAAFERAAAVWATRPDVETPAAASVLKRGFAARVMARMLEWERRRSGVVEAALAAATDSVGLHRKRRAEGRQPGFVDSLLAVRKLRAQAAGTEGPRELERGAAQSAGPAVGAAADSPPQHLIARTPEVQAAETARASERQTAALATLAKAAKTRSGAGRIAALTSLSDKLVSGLHWLPAHELPPNGLARRAVLLEELRRVYHEEMPRLGIPPDAYTLNTVLTAYCASGQEALAYEFLSSEFPRHGVSPSVVTYRSLIRLHVLHKRSDRAEGVLDTMRAQGLAPDRDCFGMLVHARAREWRVKDAIAMVVQAREAGAPIPEHWAFLLRERCKELGVRHPDVPDHPIAWQFSPRALRARRAQGRDLRKSVALGLRHVMVDGMRA